MIAYIIIILILALLMFLLLTPIYVYIDTNKKTYSLGVAGLVKGSIIPHKDFFLVRIRALFFKKTIDPLKISGKKREKKDKKEKHYSMPNFSKMKGKGQDALKSGYAVLRSFKIRTFQANVDTGDYPLNAQLIPLAVALSKNNRMAVAINFEGNNSLKLHIENNVISILSSIIKSKIVTKKK
jgi:hypothetical protein